jgi:N6-L-threonylcarbamoyladenine synthase
MIAYAGMLRLAAGESAASSIEARARWDLETLRPPAGGGAATTGSAPAN